MAPSFTFKSVPADQLSELLQKRTRQGRTSRGQSLIEDFLASSDVAATVAFGTDRERNSVAVSASNFIRTSGQKVWIKKSSPTELLLVNLAKAPADVKKAYEKRPRVGRQPQPK